ncbi:MAG: family 78 glycoside hydrolase catalytic domain [Clostridia bacterium]|nr:family 78 glycoside hydrolase catalytic domain [Clostridia bacterium]
MKNAKWIKAPYDFKQAGIIFQTEIPLKKPIKKATLFTSCVGVYNAYIDGEKIGNAVLAPGWTSYNDRVQYQKYDVTDMLKNGSTLSLECGQGWALSGLSVSYSRNFYFGEVCAIASLKVEYVDGKTEHFSTNNTWDTYTSEVLFSEIYDGETQDKTVERKCVGKAEEVKIKTKLVPQIGEWIIEHERLAPIKLFTTPKGERVIDFGQNMTGYVEFKLKAKRGEKIAITHAEVLDKDGNFYNENYRMAKNLMTYVCSGNDDIFKPKHTFQGFRYIRLDEFPDIEINLDNIRAVVVHSDMEKTGDFVCGNEKINQLYHNVIWGQKSNYLDVPTDCPQRDERLGWTGDTQVFCRTGAINYNVYKFFRKWLGELRIEQHKDGGVPAIIPVVEVFGRRNGLKVSTGWGDAVCICPWEVYLAYGNKAILKENFTAMKKWVEYIRKAGNEEYLWLTGVHFGDWLAMDAGENEYMGATSNDLIASAYYAYSTSILVKTGKILGKDVSEYERLYDNIVKRFREYFIPNGQLLSDYPLTEKPPKGTDVVDVKRTGFTQTALVLILHFNLCEEKDRAKFADMLVKMIEDNGMRMTTGFLGTPYILHALSENGRADIAYKLLLQEKAPSWLYSVNHGATTMWEHWDSLKEDGSFWSTDMNSFNHYAYGAVYDWIFGVSVGIKPREDMPGYKAVDIAPHPSKELGFVDASINTAYGKIRVKWYYKNDTVHYEISVPQAVTANLTLPSGYKTTLSGGNYMFSE